MQERKEYKKSKNPSLHNFWRNNIPNIITLSRIPSVFIIMVMMYLPWHGMATLAFFSYVAASITDWLDGYLARRYHIESNFGRLMDALIDKIFIVGMLILLLSRHILPDWMSCCVIVILSREFIVTGLRMVAASYGQILHAEKSGKQKTLAQIIAVGVLMFVYAARQDWNPLFNESFLKYVNFCGFALFGMAVILTVKSGTGYIIKYRKYLQK